MSHTPAKTLEYNYITDGIYIGTNMCCQTHFDDQLKLKEGIEVDISLEADKVDAPFGVDIYVWLPVDNHTPPTQEQLQFGVSTIKQIIQLGKKMYVHCQNGHGRAPTLVAAYLISQGRTPADAISFIKERRPSIHLDPNQIQAVEKYANTIINK